MNCCALILGRTVWKRAPNGRFIEQNDAGAASNSGLLARMGDAISTNPSMRTVVVFEPEGISHELVEMPKVDRTVFASLERIRSEHPVVASENLGWGIEIPEPITGGAYSTLIHSEMVSGLAHLKSECTQSKRQMLAAWSAYTVIEAIVRSGKLAPKPTKGIILTSGYVAVANCNAARRSFRAWVGPMSDRDWKVFSALIGDSGTKPSSSAADIECRSSSIVVVSDGDPAQNCPFWEDLHRTGRVELVMGVDRFAECAATIPINHPGNLLLIFPKQRIIDRYLLAAAVAGVLTIVAIDVGTMNESRRFQSVENSAQQRLEHLKAQLKEIEINQRTIADLRRQLLSDSESLPARKHGALVDLSIAVPDAVTLTSLSIDRNDYFAIEAQVDRGNYDPRRTRDAFTKSGFVPDQDNGWTYDTADSMLRIRGRFVEQSK
jgi:hypothetical protein